MFFSCFISHKSFVEIYICIYMYTHVYKIQWSLSRRINNQFKHTNLKFLAKVSYNKTVSNPIWSATILTVVMRVKVFIQVPLVSGFISGSTFGSSSVQTYDSSNAQMLLMNNQLCGVGSALRTSMTSKITVIDIKTVQSVSVTSFVGVRVRSSTIIARKRRTLSRQQMRYRKGSKPNI